VQGLGKTAQRAPDGRGRGCVGAGQQGGVAQAVLLRDSVVASRRACPARKRLPHAPRTVCSEAGTHPCCAAAAQPRGGRAGRWYEARRRSRGQRERAGTRRTARHPPRSATGRPSHPPGRPADTSGGGRGLASQEGPSLPSSWLVEQQDLHSTGNSARIRRGVALMS